MNPQAEAMLRTIEDHVAATAHETGCATLSGPLRHALLSVPRDRFVPAAQRHHAWEDAPLPIGHGQTISQPFIVALMSALVEPQPGSRLLEVGCGCGYQAAVLAAAGARVFGVEIVEPLARRAAATLSELGYGEVTIRAGDGYGGWPEQAPFDGILVTAAGADVPDPLRQQLRVGGRMVLPVESPSGLQELLLVTRESDQVFRSRSVLAVRFVPLTRGVAAAD